mmetsp:Transcript_10438/g.15885  ORF Transcript_10438/g.15885 Transcript_10438/m.15885 type:complete len:297 (+) Transcript_10438:126-1016(+)|eukprot:CAMPEP_0185020882 /NCGR_PEP_ID=MMETSP1103-20130426/3527_1 /TAXON_ID=36769 /ORGANISM="Paraphysomonas bandaiensis, Strain Caron Lab Isolate" /LENGTH=296 /DNA_ID=CAMNT_0027552061 /DNA_START=43 /DNA_END=933 /DNA_ORIENTATION=-
MLRYISSGRVIRKRFLSSLHPAAASGFSKDNVARYEAARPSYTDEVLNLLMNIIVPSAEGNQSPNKPEYSLCELGAGTGKFTHSFLDYVRRNRNIACKFNYLAVEPSDFAHHLEGLSSSITVKRGFGENIPTSDDSTDAVMIAQAFHWMANESCLKEIHRILKPGSPLILVWNGYDSDIDWIRRFESDIIVPHYTPDVPRYQSMEWRHVFESNTTRSLFSPLRTEHFVNATVGPIEMVVGRALSTSVIASKNEDERRAIEEQVYELLRTHPDTKHIDKNGQYNLQYRTLVAYTRAL